MNEAKLEELAANWLASQLELSDSPYMTSNEYIFEPTKVHSNKSIANNNGGNQIYAVASLEV